MLRRPYHGFLMAHHSKTTNLSVANRLDRLLQNDVAWAIASLREAVNKFQKAEQSLGWQSLQNGNLGKQIGASQKEMWDSPPPPDHPLARYDTLIAATYLTFKKLGDQQLAAAMAFADGFLSAIQGFHHIVDIVQKDDPRILSEVCKTVEEIVAPVFTPDNVYGFTLIFTFEKLSAELAGKTLKQTYELLGRSPHFLGILECYPPGVTDAYVQCHGEALFTLVGNVEFLNRYHYWMPLQPRDTLATVIDRRWRGVRKEAVDQIILGLLAHERNAFLKSISSINEPFPLGTDRIWITTPKSQNDEYVKRVREYLEAKARNPEMLPARERPIVELYANVFDTEVNHRWADRHTEGNPALDKFQPVFRGRLEIQLAPPGDLDKIGTVGGQKADKNLEEAMQRLAVAVDEAVVQANSVYPPTDPIKSITDFNEHLLNPMLSLLHAELRRRLGSIAGARLPNDDAKRALVRATNFAIDRLGVRFGDSEGQHYRLNLSTGRRGGGAFQFAPTGGGGRASSVTVPDFSKYHFVELER